jgi:hypothetical protein
MPPPPLPVCSHVQWRTDFTIPPPLSLKASDPLPFPVCSQVQWQTNFKMRLQTVDASSLPPLPWDVTDKAGTDVEPASSQVRGWSWATSAIVRFVVTTITIISSITVSEHAVCQKSARIPHRRSVPYPESNRIGVFPRLPQDPPGIADDPEQSGMGKLVRRTSVAVLGGLRDTAQAFHGRVHTVSATKFHSHDSRHAATGPRCLFAFADACIRTETSIIRHLVLIGDCHLG